MYEEYTIVNVVLEYNAFPDHLGGAHILLSQEPESSVAPSPVSIIVVEYDSR